MKFSLFCGVVLCQKEFVATVLKITQKMRFQLKFKMRLSHLELNLVGKNEDKTCLEFQQISYGANCFAKIGLKISPQKPIIFVIWC